MSQNSRHVFNNMAKSLHCPGLYCGRLRLGDSGNYSECGSCPRGFRVNGSVCEECVSGPEIYDWLYLGFMVLLSIDIQGWIIDRSRRKLGCRAFVLELCCLLENVLSAILSLISLTPIGSLSLTTCKAQRLSDWYTMLHNPTPNYQQTIHCSQEAVYPLYSIVFVYLGYSLLLIVLFRGILLPRLVQSLRSIEVRQTVYLALYAIPIMGIIHAVCAGILYYSFPYLVIIFSVISIACHLAARQRQSVTDLFKESVEPRNLVVILSHWFIHAFGLIAASINAHGVQAFFSLLLVPLPTFFYIFTARFTDPERFEE